MQKRNVYQRSLLSQVIVGIATKARIRGYRLYFIDHASRHFHEVREFLAGDAAPRANLRTLNPIAA